MESPNYVGFRALQDRSKKFLNRESEESRTDRIRKGCACINDTLTDKPAMLASVAEDVEQSWENRGAMNQTVRDLISSMKLQTM